MNTGEKHASFINFSHKRTVGEKRPSRLAYITSPFCHENSCLSAPALPLLGPKTLLLANKGPFSSFANEVFCQCKRPLRIYKSFIEDYKSEYRGQQGLRMKISRAKERPTISGSLETLHYFSRRKMLSGRDDQRKTQKGEE